MNQKKDDKTGSASIKVADYGEMLAVVNDLEPVFYAEAGSYQGSYVAINADDTRLFFYVGSYGSCSGCDWLEAEENADGEVDFKAAVEYCADFKPCLILPKAHQNFDVLKLVIAGLTDDYDRLSDDDITDAISAVKSHLKDKS